MIMMTMITTLNLVAGRWRSGNNPPRWASSAWIVEIMIVAMMVMVKMGMVSILVIRSVEVSLGANLQRLKGLEKQSAHLNRN